MGRLVKSLGSFGWFESPFTRKLSIPPVFDPVWMVYGVSCRGDARLKSYVGFVSSLRNNKYSANAELVGWRCPRCEGVCFRGWQDADH